VKDAPGGARPANILVVDDDPVVAGALRGVLIAAGYDVPPVVARSDDLPQALADHSPSLVLMDIDLGEAESGIEIAARLPSDIPVLFVSAHADPATLERARKRRPAGFVVKPFDALQLRAAVEMALEQAAPASGPRTIGLPDLPELATLSAREREVLEHLLAHKRAPAIAKALFISQHTVRNHLKNIFAKLHVSSQQELLDRLTK
jgi:DNA-binding NarL/FixJ family response regulator